MNWEKIKNYEGYEVSDTGLVRSTDKYITVSGGNKRFLKGKILTPKINQDGYAILSLTKDGKKQSFYVHRLVATAYIPNPNNLPEVNHLLGDKLNNAVENLEWVTHAQNVQHAYYSGLNKNQQGNHHNAVCIIDNFLGMEFSTLKDWCTARNISYSTGKNILCGNRNSKEIDLTMVIKLNKNELLNDAA